LERMKKGDVFVLGGKKYIYLYTRGMNIYVKATVDRPPTIPSWFSEMLPLAFDSGLEINRFRKLMNEKFASSNTGDAKKEIQKFISEHLYVGKETSVSIYNYFYEQHKYLEIPDSGLMLVERYNSEKHYLIFHSMYGRRVNDALSRAIGFLLGRLGGRDIELGISDNSFYVAGENMKIEKALELLKKEKLYEILKEAVDRTDVLARRFRHCATRALMILRSYKGRAKTVGKQQMKSHFLLGAVKKISSEFPILREARREVLEDLMDIENSKKVISWIKEGKVKVKIRSTPLPSPFALNLMLQGHTDLIKIEDKQAFLKRMHELHMKEIERKNK
jgi:ATP-dependent Lhr-like helicase